MHQYGEEGNFSDFGHVMVFGTRRIVLNISETDNLLPTAFLENDKKKENISSERQKSLADDRE